MKAFEIPRFSIVKFNGRNYVLENALKKPYLVYEENGMRKGVTIFRDTELEVVLYPAQSAFEMLANLANAEQSNPTTQTIKQ